MKKKSFLTLFLLQSILLFSQGVGISDNGASPHSSAILDASSTSKGFLPPRMTTAQRDAIPNPASMLMIANTTTNCLEIFIPPNWQNIFCGCSSAPTNLSYTYNGPLTYCINQVISPNLASTQGSIPSSFTINPPLPAGLTINNVTGQITGTPLTSSPQTAYTITAQNACGSSTKELNISVVTTPSTPTVITGFSSPTLGSTAIYFVAAETYATSYDWVVPVDWTVVSGQGTSSISVLVGNASGNITVSASNGCGSSSSVSKAVSSWRPITASGGSVNTYTADGNNGLDGVQYKVHSFMATGTSSFTVSDIGTDGKVDYLVIAGGGGGAGTGAGGGGGAGGYLFGSNMTLTASAYPVVVGQGGAGGSNGWEVCSIVTQFAGANGGVSSFNGIQATGGGGGGLWSSPGANGGSGGGASGRNNAAGGLGIALQGTNGGNSRTADVSGSGGGGGGGGAHIAGASANGQIGGNGGSGKISTINGSSIARAGGGGGGVYDGFNYGGNPGTGGSGGGGNGGFPLNNLTGMGQDALANTGSGGGGAGGRCQPGVEQGYSGQRGGNGGSGIVIIRYPVSNPNPN